MVSLRRFATESVASPKYSTIEPPEYCAVPSEKSMVSFAQPEPQSRPSGPVVVCVRVGFVALPQVPHWLGLYGAVESAVPKVVFSS